MLRGGEELGSVSNNNNFRNLEEKITAKRVFAVFALLALFHPTAPHPQPQPRTMHPHRPTLRQGTSRSAARMLEASFLALGASVHASLAVTNVAFKGSLRASLLGGTGLVPRIQ